MGGSSNRPQTALGPGFLDLFFNIALGFCALLLITIILVSIPTEGKKIDPKAEYLVIMTWPDNDPNDFDLWVKDPIGNTVSYAQKKAGLVHLERDDLGISNDTTVDADGEIIKIFKNQEVTSIRGFVPGTWHVSTYYYNRYQMKNRKLDVDVSFYTVPVKVELVQINPYKILYSKEVEFFEDRVEHTMFNFDIIQNEDKYFVDNINEEPVRITYHHVAEG